jgi:hypothetical protein
MKDNADPRRIHSAVCVTVQMTLAAQASSAAKAHDGKHHFAALHSGSARTPISVAPLRNAVSSWLAPSGIKSASSKLCPAASLAVAAPTSVNGSEGSHGPLNAEAYSSTMVQFSRARSSPSQKPFSRRAFDLSAYRIIGCHDSADGVSQQASPISGLFVDFDFEARILERAGIIIKRWCVQSCALGA